MSSIDERVVEMEFKSSGFQRGIQTTLASLDKLKKSMDFKSSTKSLGELDKAGKKFDLSALGDGVDKIGVKFGALQVAGVTALANIANRAVNAGVTLVKSLTVDPIQAGLQEYETQLNSVQTILANTKSKGSTLKDVNASLKELNDYADLTIYNFTEMTRNIGTFTAAGVDLDTSTNAIKGIANLAALSGSNSQQASTAMYQLSQAMATGTVKLMDWNSVVTAGMGGQVFQDALKETARVSGVAIDDIIKKSGSFRDSLQEGWLTTDILTDTLSHFTQDLSDEQLKAQGYTDEQIADIKELAETATDAATKVKTATQLLDVLKEAVGSGWAQTWQTVFGDFEEAKELWTGASDVLTDIIGDASDARNQLLSEWKEAGGRDAMIESVKNTFEALMTVLGPIKEAFSEIFPPITGKRLAELTENVAEFTEKLKMGEGSLAKVKSIFKGFFAALDIGRMIIVSAVEMFSDLFGVATEGAGGIFDNAAAFGDWIVEVRDALKEGEDISKFFENLKGILEIPINIIKTLGDAFGWLWDKITGGKELADTATEDISTKIEKRFEPLVKMAEWLGEKWEAFKGVLADVWNAMEPLTTWISDAFGVMTDSITNAFKTMDIDALLDIVNTGLFATLVLFAKKLVDSFGKKGADKVSGGGLLDSIKDVFGGLTDTLSTMQGTLKAGTLLMIAGAVALLTASVVALSLVDPKALAVALGGITAMFGQLIGTMAAFDKVGTAKSAVTLPLLAAGLIGLSVAVVILAGAVRMMADLEPKQLATGLAGITTMLAALAGTAKLMAGSGKGMITAGAGLILVATAIRILVDAVKEFSGMGWEEIGKGLAAVAGILVALGLFTKFGNVGAAGLLSGAGILLMAYGIKTLAEAVISMSDLGWEQIGKGIAALGGIFLVIGAFSKLSGNGANLILSAAGMLIMGEALKSIAGVVIQFGDMEWGEIGKGLATLAGAMAAIALAIGLLPPSSLLSAAAIFVVAQSLSLITDAVSVGAGMEWEEIGKGMVVLAGALGIIALAMYAMTGALPGAAALLVAAGALYILMPIIEHMGTLEWSQIGTGLGALAAALGIMALAGILLIPAIPGLVGLGLALALIGAGIALAGVGVLAFATGLAALAVASVAGVAAIKAIGMAIISLIPMALSALGQGLVMLARIIGENAPALVEALVQLVTALLEGLLELAPMIIETVLQLLQMLLDALLEYAPTLVDTGLQLLEALLEGISEHIERITELGLEIIVGFLDGIAEKIDDVVEAGVGVIVSFIEGVTDSLDDIIDAGTDLIVTFIEGVSDSMDDILDAGTDLIVTFLEGLTEDISLIATAATNVVTTLLDEMGNHITEIGTAATDFVVDLMTEIGNNSQEIIDTGGDVIISLIEGLGTKSTEIATAAGDTMVDFLEGIDTWLDNNETKIQNLGKSIAGHIASGMTLGLSSKVASVASAAADMAGGALNAAKNLLGIASPSKEFIAIGKFVGEGFLIGMQGTTADISDAFWGLNSMLKDLIAESKQDIKDYKSDISELKSELAEMEKDGEKGTAAYKKKTKALKEAEAALKQSTKEYNKATKARKYLLNNLKDERDRLKKLSKEYDTVTTKLEAAQDALADAKDERDSFKESIADDNDNFADFDSETQSLEEYIATMQEQVEKTAALRAGLKQLEALGLNDKLYQQLAEGGVDSLDFVTSILEGGQEAVWALNDINDDLDATADAMAKETSSALYQAGVDSAKGLVAGLKAQQEELEELMEKIATKMVNAIKNKLDINSPSRVFKREVGEQVPAGIAEGIKATSGVVEKATEEVGQDALDSLKQVMSEIGNAVYDDIDLDPTITPIIDLSEVRSGVGAMNGLLGNAIDLGTSAGAASSTASAVRDQIGTGTDAYTAAGNQFIFNQTNNSPESLSTGDIYRNTENIISKAKGALTNA